MIKQYVQHISGQGEKWEVMTDNGHQWGLHHNVNSIGWHFVPKSEYRLCEPPEVWKDVTEGCEVRSGKVWHEGCRVLLPENWDRYRMRKANLCDGWAFIVEKKVQP